MDEAKLLKELSKYWWGVLSMGIVVYVIGLQRTWIFANFDPIVCTVLQLIGTIIMIIGFFMFRKKHNHNLKKCAKIGLWILFVLLLFFCILGIIYRWGKSNINNGDPVQQPTEGHITKTPTPIYETIQDLPICIPKDENFPCRYLTTGENPEDIADAFYSHRTELAGRIMEFYRDENGTIPVFKENKTIIIPEDIRKRDLEYYEFYFQLLDYPISQCPYIISPPTPCWYISKGESYKELANGYPTIIKDSCIPGANKTEWSKTDYGLLPKTIEPGTMIVLPVCP